MCIYLKVMYCVVPPLTQGFDVVHLGRDFEFLLARFALPVLLAGQFPSEFVSNGKGSLPLACFVRTVGTPVDEEGAVFIGLEVTLVLWI